MTATSAIMPRRIHRLSSHAGTVTNAKRNVATDGSRTPARATTQAMEPNAMMER